MQTGLNLCELREKRVLKGAITSFFGMRIVEVYGLICVRMIFTIILMVSIFGKFTFAQTVASSDASKVYQTFTSIDVPKNLTESQTITSSLVISESGCVSDINVQIAITHQYCPDLDVYLIAPDGTRVELVTELDGYYGYYYTILDDEAAVSVTMGDTAGYPDTYKPEGHLSDLYGKNLSGTWMLEVTDDTENGTYGQIIFWSLTISKGFSSPVIQSRKSISKEICDTVSWDDIGSTRKYKDNLSQTIPDNGTLKSEKIVNDYYLIEDVNVIVDILHNRDSELNVFLVSPDNTRVELFTDVGGSSANFNNTIFDDQAAVSITTGSAPFRGIYKPEGKLSDLIGKNIFGKWTLEVSDDTQSITGTLSSWQLLANTADIVYYAECSLDSNFNNIHADSGWMIDRSFTFDNLDPNQQYWYRTKARDLNTWIQATKNDFKTGVLANTLITDDGKVKIDPKVVPTRDEQKYVIENPGFESEEAWQVAANNSYIMMGSISKQVWATEGNYAAAILFEYGYGIYFGGDYAFFVQEVDWTDVDTLKFDFCCQAFNFLTASVNIGGKQVWKNVSKSTSVEERLNQTIDVSQFKGVQEITLKVTFDLNTIATFDSLIMWDNFRTYKKVAVEGQTTGSIISAPVTIKEGDTWDIMAFNATIPAGASLTIDILPETGTTPITGYANLPTNADLSGINARTIRLRANLTTNSSSVSPELDYWVVSYTSASSETEWSNVVTSNCSQ